MGWGVVHHRSDESNLDIMHLLGFPLSHDLRSLRDLRGANLPLLRAIRADGLRILKERFGLRASKVRVYFHYLPTFYHLHVVREPTTLAPDGL